MADVPQYCPWCAGTGTVSTGIDEASETQCDDCDGTGLVQPKPVGSTMTNETTASQPKSIGDDAQFRSLMNAWDASEHGDDADRIYDQIAAYIDSRAPAAPVAQEGKSLNAKAADLLRPFLKPGQKVIWREPFRWHDDNGVLSNHYDGASLESLSDDFGYVVPYDFNFMHAAIVGPQQEGSEAGNG